MSFVNFIIMIVVFVGLSLLCSFILFKVLKSSATVKKKKVQLGGAIAGFVVILVLLLQSFNAWYEHENDIKKIKKEAEQEAEERFKPEMWTICAHRVVKGTNGGEESGDQGGIIGRVIPSTMTETESSGYFRLENVVKLPDEPWPDLMFEYEGYHPKFVDNLDKWINEKNKDEVEIDDNKKRITLLKKIKLAKKGGKP